MICPFDIPPASYHGAVAANVGLGGTVYVAAEARLFGAAVVIVGDLKLAHPAQR